MPEQVQCPKCQQTLRLPDTLMGKKVKCPKCATIFEGVAKPTSGSVPKEPRSREEPAPAPRKKPAPPPPDEDEELDELPVSKKRPAARDEDYEEEDDLEEEPRPKKKKKGGGRKRALDRIYGPAIALQVLGATGLVLIVLNFAYALTLGRAEFFERLAQHNTPPERVGQAIAIFVGPLWYLAVLLSARNMKNLDSYRNALVLSIIAMIPCTCCFLGLPFGIWTLIVINSAEVRPYFNS